ncbi:MAG: GtrA family protein [Burkholderiaceae bacterium]|nr:GtrA family protein [Burkholderiaceae bacterium]MCD8517700.1 GtrA family protein [Burkholderiaceae bacterium]MCD8536723.1 GtrA family protein [Burkholderiaceae bacterium]MCD8564696.1 GtrA family protein [Burkholderiaceae bacterium]
MKKLSHQLAWFVAVGASAALVHWIVVVVLVSGGYLTPLVANVIGWLVAFGVSFTGHYQLTFRHQRSGVKDAVWRFFLLSAAGFAINETSYALLLKQTRLPYELLLALILIGVAVLTFVASRLWAFNASSRAH